MMGILTKLKKKLMFTGWLQYLPPGIISLFFYLCAMAAIPVHSLFLIILLLTMGTVSAALFLKDLYIVKWGHHKIEPLPEKPENLTSFEILMKRRSCRSFQLRNLEEEDLRNLLDIIKMEEKPPIRVEYIHAPLRVWPVVNAREFLILLGPGPYNREEIIQGGQVMQRVVNKATLSGLDTCWIGRGADVQSIQSHMGNRFNPEKDHILAICAIGYRSRYKPLMIRVMHHYLHRRHHLSYLFYTDSYLDGPLPVDKDPYSRFRQAFDFCRWAPSSLNSQTTRSAARLEGNKPEKLIGFDFFTLTDSHFYTPLALGIWCANWEMSCELLGIEGEFTVMEAPEMRQLPEYSVHYDITWKLKEPILIERPEKGFYF